MASSRTPEPCSPTSPADPTSPTSPKLRAFLDEPEDDVLEWIGEWEQRNSTMDKKHVEVLCSQWQLMRESAKEHSNIIHHMKKAIHELRSNGMTVHERLDDMERRLRQELNKDQDNRLTGMEQRFCERMDKLQHAQHAEARRNDERYEVLQDDLERERQAREAGANAVQQLLAKEHEVLQGIKQFMSDEAKGQAGLRERLSALERLNSEAAERQAAELAALRRDLSSRAESGLERLLQKFEGKTPATEEDLAAVRDLVTREKLAREMGDQNLQELLERELANTRSQLEGEKDARERFSVSVQQTLDDHKSGPDPAMEERLEQLQLDVQQEKCLREASLERLREQLLRACQEAVDREVDKVMKEAVRLDQELKKEQMHREAGIDRLREFFLRTMPEAISQEIRAERALREAGLEKLREQLFADHQEVEGQLAAMKNLVAACERAGKAGLAEERALRERLGEALRLFAEDLVSQQHLSIQERLDDLLVKLQAEVQKELASFDVELKGERGSREAAVATLRELLGAQKVALEQAFGALRDRLAEEQQAREAGDKAVEDLLLQEALEREAADDAVRAEVGKEADARSGLHDGIMRAMEERMLTYQAHVQDRFDNLLQVVPEKIEEEMLQERRLRESSLDHLRELVGGDKVVTERALNTLAELLDAERQAREEADEALEKQLQHETSARTEETREARRLQNLQQAALETFRSLLSKETTTRESEGEALKAGLAALRSALDKEEAALDALRKQLQSETAKRTEENREVWRELSLRESAYDGLRALLGSETAARERDLEALKARLSALRDFLDNEAERREALVGEVRADVASERDARTKQCEAVRQAVQERLDKVLMMLHASSNSMRLSWQETGVAAVAEQPPSTSVF